MHSHVGRVSTVLRQSFHARRVLDVGQVSRPVCRLLRSCSFAASTVLAAGPKPPAAKTDKAASPAAAAPPRRSRFGGCEGAGPGGQAAAKKVKQLSPEMAERRDRVRRLLAALRSQPFNTQQNTCTDVLDFCRAFGCETELTDNATSGQKVNGITCLCWNMPCAGYELMTVSEGHLAAARRLRLSGQLLRIGRRPGPVARSRRLPGPGRQDRSHGGRLDRV